MDVGREVKGSEIEMDDGVTNMTQETSKRRKKFEVREGGEINFNEEELKRIYGFKRGVDYVEVLCGSTNWTYGDYVGTLRIDSKGEFSVTCDHCPGCTTGNVTLEQFEKHAQREDSGKWKSSIWVHTEEEDKVPLWKTPLLKYYTHQANVANWSDATNRKKNFHRDEFMRCSSCNKERRFRLRSRPEIKEYHVALTNKTWTCFDFPYQRITCNVDEERPSLRESRGCPRASFCTGCTFCYCNGCIKCRFEDCSCQECKDFMSYAET